MTLPLPTLALAATIAQAHGERASSLGHALPLASVVPFALLLVCIATFPLAFPHWWESNRHRAIVSAAFALPFALYLFLVHGATGRHALFEAGTDYVAFLSLLAALYVIAGGVVVKGSLAGSPLSNTTFLAIGALLANLIGTTGASMVLIRPVLRANATREKRVHVVVFFIFIVSNCGGMLTPLGDPPLYLGFLKGVPFAWTVGLWKEWATVVAALLIVFFFIDSYVLDREERERPGSQLEDVLKHEPPRIEGWLNVALLFGVVAVIAAKGSGVGAASGPWPYGVLEAAMFGLAATSYACTRKDVYAANQFKFGPIVEVAVLFAGIFVTMVAPLAILNARGSELGLVEPWHYFWTTGALSSVLDNAPTYLSFAATACGQAGVPAEGSHYLADFLAKGAHETRILEAISCGAVMMGANTYIGNGPNFMVKSIAEANGVKMPSFFGYIGWSVCVLIPVFVGITFLFFR